MGTINANEEMDQMLAQMQEFRKNNRKRRTISFDENSNDHSNKMPGKRNCKRCYGRGYNEFSNEERNGLYRLNCTCIKIEQES